MIQEKLKHNSSIASRNNKKHQYLLRDGQLWTVSIGLDIDDRRKIMKLVTVFMGGKAPRNVAALNISRVHRL